MTDRKLQYSVEQVKAYADLERARAHLALRELDPGRPELIYSASKTALESLRKYAQMVQDDSLREPLLSTEEIDELEGKLEFKIKSEKQAMDYVPTRID